MKKAVLMFWGALTVGLTGGCLWGSSYTLPETYDLPVMKAMPVPTPVQFVSFRNLSGADRRFMTRRPDGRIVFDDGRRFLESPELLLERALREAVTGSDRSGAAVKINGVIRRFEFTAPAATAVLGVEFYLTLDRRHLTCGGNFTAPVVRDDRAAAMAECVEQAAAALARGIDKLVMENKVKSDEKKL